MSQKLWQAVLLPTIEDALLGPSQVDNRVSRIRICKDARRYLTSPNPDLAEVCALADMDMETVIERMRTKIAQTPTPEELADSLCRNAASLTKKAVKPKVKRIPLKDRPYTIGGETRTIAEWCDRSGISIALAQARRSLQTSFAEHSAKIKEGLRHQRLFKESPREAPRLSCRNMTGNRGPWQNGQRSPASQRSRYMRGSPGKA